MIDKPLLNWFFQKRKDKNMQTQEYKFSQGQQVRDRVTGFTGVVSAQCTFINGCKQYIVQPQVDPTKPGELIKSEWMDEPGLVLVGDGISKDLEPKNTGGPQRMPDRRS